MKGLIIGICGSGFLGDAFFQFIHLGTSLFVLICGFSLILRQRRMEGASRKAYNIAVVKRGVQVILVGILFAVISSVIIYFFISDGRYMMFNFLMMMGCSMIIALPFVPLKKWAVIPAVLFIVLGFVLSSIHGPLFLMPLYSSRIYRYVECFLDDERGRL